MAWYVKLTCFAALALIVEALIGARL